MAGKKPDTLNPKQKEFCRLYATDREFFGNGVESYCEAYGLNFTDPKEYKVAATSAYRLLKKPEIIAEINKQIVETGFNESSVDKELSFLVTQHADLGTKLGAIKEFNKLKQRIVERQDITTNGKDLPTPIYGSKSA